MQKITPFLWYNTDLTEVVEFYKSIFKDVVLVNTSPGPDGKIMSAIFKIYGQQFYALNGGPMFKFTEAVSFFVSCDTQEEIDDFWEKLSAGGEKSRCGWLKDKYGLSWQIVPPVLGELLGGADTAKAQRVMNAMLQMDKLDIQKLKDA